MKAAYSFKNHSPVLFSILMVLVLSSSSVAQESPEPQSEIQINFRSPLSVWLKINEVSKDLSEANVPLGGGYAKWIGSASLRWEVEVPEKDDYEVYLTANVTEAGDGTKITIEAAKREPSLPYLKLQVHSPAVKTSKSRNH